MNPLDALLHGAGNLVNEGAQAVGHFFAPPPPVASPLPQSQPSPMPAPMPHQDFVSMLGNVLTNTVHTAQQDVGNAATAVSNSFQHGVGGLEHALGDAYQTAMSQPLLNTGGIPLHVPTIGQAVNTVAPGFQSSALGQFAQGKFQNVPAALNQTGQQFLKDTQNPQKFAAMLVNGMVGGGGEGTTEKQVTQDILPKAYQTFNDILSASVGRAGKQYSQDELDTAVSNLAGKNLDVVDDPYKQQAIKLANFIDATKHGATVNPPPGVGLAVQNVRQHMPTPPTPQEQQSIRAFEDLLANPTTVTGERGEPLASLPEKPAPTLTKPQGQPDFAQIAQQGRLASSGTNRAIAFRTGNLVTKMDQVLKTPEDNLNFRLAMESPAKLDEYAAQSKNPQAFKALAQQYSDYTDYVLQQAKASGATMSGVEDYFTHIWDLSTPEAQAKLDELMRAHNFSSRFTRQRLFQSIQQGLDAGLTLKNPKASQDVLDYASSMGRQIANQAFNQQLNELLPNSAVEFKTQGSVPVNNEGKPYLQSNLPGNQGTFLDPRIQQHMSFYNPSALAESQLMAGKDIQLGGKTLHIPGIDQLNQLDKETKLALGGFHGFNTSLREAIHNPLALPQATWNFLSDSANQAYQEQAISDGVIDYGSKLGVTFGSSGDVDRLNGDLLSKLQSNNPIRIFNNRLFGNFINTFKIDLTRGMMAKFPDALTDPAQAAKAQNYAKQINDLMGGLNYEAMGRNKTVQQVFRLIGLAPDFSEGTLHQLTTALNPGNYLNATTRPAGLFALRSVLGQVAAIAALTETGRLLTTGKFDPDFKSFVQNNLLKPSFPLPQQFTNPKSGISQVAHPPTSEFGTLLSAVQDPMHFVQARGSGVLSALGSLTSGTDYYGNPLVNPWSNQPDTLTNRAKALLPNQLPIPVQQLLKLRQGAQTPATTALNTAGFRVGANPQDPTYLSEQTYFNGLAQAAKTLNPNDQQTFMGLLHPTTKDQNGNRVVTKTPFTKVAQYTTLLDNPQILAAEVAFQRGQPGHSPIWDAQPQQLHQFLLYEAINKLTPGSAEEKQFLKNHPDALTLIKANGQWGSQFAGQGTASPAMALLPPLPVASPYVEAQLTAKNYNDPQVQSYLNAHTAYVNAERQAIGLAPLDQYGNIQGSKNYGKVFASGSASGLLPAATRRSIMREQRYQNKQFITKEGETFAKLLHQPVVKPLSAFPSGTIAIPKHTGSGGKGHATKHGSAHVAAATRVKLAHQHSLVPASKGTSTTVASLFTRARPKQTKLALPKKHKAKRFFA